MDTTPYPAVSYTLTDLMKGTYYSVRVSLSNSAGNGLYSSPEIGRTAVDRECLNVACSHGTCICFVGVGVLISIGFVTSYILHFHTCIHTHTYTHIYSASTLS